MPSPFKRSLPLLILLFAMVIVSPLLGEVFISPSAIFGDDALTKRILLELRIPRVVLAFIAGASLSICGVVYQGLFRNVLASPFTLGISGGAAFGMALSVKLGATFTLLGMSSNALAAMFGACFTMLAILGLSVRSGGASVTVILAGVVISFFFSSLIMLLQYLGDFAEVFRITHWMLGSVDTVGFSSIALSAPAILVGTAMLFFDSYALNLISLGDETALTKGVNLRAVQFRLLLGSSLIIGSIVSLCGPIGFIGILVPFITRLFFGYEHRTVMIGSILIGGPMLVICDAASRVLFAPAEVPVGVVTALIGGPIFIWALIKGKFFSGRDSLV